MQRETSQSDNTNNRNRQGTRPDTRARWNRERYEREHTRFTPDGGRRPVGGGQIPGNFDWSVYSELRREAYDTPIVPSNVDQARIQGMNPTASLDAVAALPDTSLNTAPYPETAAPDRITQVGIALDRIRGMDAETSLNTASYPRTDDPGRITRTRMALQGRIQGIAPEDLDPRIVGLERHDHALIRGIQNAVKSIESGGMKSFLEQEIEDCLNASSDPNLFAVKLNALKRFVSQNMEINIEDTSDRADSSDFSYDKTPPEYKGESSNT